jgi:hypothetical protein
MMLRTWNLTVLGLRYSWAPISRFDIPFAMSRMISTWRAVRQWRLDLGPADHGASHRRCAVAVEPGAAAPSKASVPVPWDSSFSPIG